MAPQRCRFLPLVVVECVLRFEWHHCNASPLQHLDSVFEGLRLEHSTPFLSSPSSLVRRTPAGARFFVVICTSICKIWSATCTSFYTSKSAKRTLGDSERVRCHNLRGFVFQGLRGSVGRGLGPQGWFFSRGKFLDSFDVQGSLDLIVLAFPRSGGSLESLEEEPFRKTFFPKDPFSDPNIFKAE